MGTPGLGKYFSFKRMSEVCYHLVNKFQYVVCLCISLISTLRLNLLFVLIRSFLIARPSNSFLQSYIIIVGLVYLHKHVWYTRFSIICLFIFVLYSFGLPIIGVYRS